MTDSRGLPVILLLLLGAALTGWLLMHTERGLVPSAPQRRELPDYRLSGVRLRVFDANGALHYRLRADRLIHYPAPDRSELSMPLLHWYPHPNAVPWVVRAASGEVLDAGGEVRLLGTVHIDRAAHGTRRAVTILTRDLVVWPRRNLAQTAARVTLCSDGTDLSGVGMRADLRRGRVVLLSSVRGTYVQAHS